MVGDGAGSDHDSTRGLTPHGLVRLRHGKVRKKLHHAWAGHYRGGGGRWHRPPWATQTPRLQEEGGEGARQAPRGRAGVPSTSCSARDMVSALVGDGTRADPVAPEPALLWLVSDHRQVPDPLCAPRCSQASQGKELVPTVLWRREVDVTCRVAGCCGHFMFNS